MSGSAMLLSVHCTLSELPWESIVPYDSMILPASHASPKRWCICPFLTCVHFDVQPVFWNRTQSYVRDSLYCLDISTDQHCDSLFIHTTGLYSHFIESLPVAKQWN